MNRSLRTVCCLFLALVLACGAAFAASRVDIPTPASVPASLLADTDPDTAALTAVAAELLGLDVSEKNAVNAWAAILESVDPHVLSTGATGSEVKAAQAALLAYDPTALPVYGADGMYGRETVDAIKAAETALGLPAVGEYGPAIKAVFEGHAEGLDDPQFAMMSYAARLLDDGSYTEDIEAALARFGDAETEEDLAVARSDMAEIVVLELLGRSSADTGSAAETVAPTAEPVGETVAKPTEKPAGQSNGHYETVYHEAEYEAIEHPAVYEQIQHEAEYKTVHHDQGYSTVEHPAEYTTVHHDAETKTVEHEAVYEDVVHPEEGHWETVTVPAVTHTEEKKVYVYGYFEYIKAKLYTCKTCKWQTYDPNEMHDHVWLPDHIVKIPVLEDSNGNIVYADQSAFYGSRMVTVEKIPHEDPTSNEIIDTRIETVTVVDTPESTSEVWVVDKEATTERVLVQEAWTETVVVKEAWEESVLVKEAWTETVLVDEPYDETVLVRPAWTENVMVQPAWIEGVLVKEAWTERVWVED